MFRLVRFFVLTSAAAAAVVAVAFVLHRQSEVERLIALAERQNVELARAFANTIWPHFSTNVASASRLEEDKAQAHQEREEINRAVKAVVAGLPVLKVKIYDLEGLTVYSSDPDEIGEFKTNNPGFFSAAREGRPASKLTYRNNFSSFEEALQERDLVESYLPIRQDGGPVEAVFELYTDVTPLMNDIERSTTNLVVGVLPVFAALYGALFLVVRRANRTIQQQYGEITDKNATLQHEISERKTAQEALEITHDELEQRVDERTRELTEEIGERKRAEESLRKLSRAVEQSPAMTIITDPNGIIEYVNPRFTEVTGYTLEEAAGETPRFLKSGETPLAEYEKLWKTVTAGKEWRSEMRNRKKNGELYWALLTISPITNQDGTLVHFLGISEDITERKRAEDEARRQRNELAQLGRVIIMGEMATSLAHELNQPLTVISGCAQVCLKRLRSDGSKPEELLESMEQVTEQAERANQIIRRVRSFIRKEEQERGKIDVNEAIRNVADLLHSDAREHGAGIELDLAAALPTVVADPFQIQQVILNLVHNGMEAMSEVCPASRHLTIHTSASGDGAVEIAVCDQGQGMPTEVLDRIFDPFFTTKSTGLGMGLSICRSIIESHGGRLWATSDSGIGTVFRFSLPIAGKSNRDDA